MSGSRSSSPNSISEWSKQENKKFEQALAYYGEDTPNRWDKVSLAMGGSKSAEEVWYHYLDLVHDVKKIESRQVPYPKYKEQGFWTYSDIIGQLEKGSGFKSLCLCPIMPTDQAEVMGAPPAEKLSSKSLRWTSVLEGSKVIQLWLENKG